MAKYPIKMLKDEEGTPFVPLVSTEALRTPEGVTIEEKLEKKLEPSNLIAGTDITLSVDGNNITINNASKGVLIDNLTTEQSGTFLFTIVAPPIKHFLPILTSSKTAELAPI